MNATVSLEPNAADIAAFTDALFRYADPGSFASLRAFRDDEEAPPVFRCGERIGDTLDTLAARATTLAREAALKPWPVVFCPPVATFTGPDRAREADLANGLALSVECDAAPEAARAKLESLLGPATVLVESGGEWLNPETGELERKLHLHWRLSEPTRAPEDHGRLKLGRTLATALVGGDATNAPMVHPIRWPGSWHRKRAPRLSRIIACRSEREIELSEALEALQEAARAVGVCEPSAKAAEASTGTGEARDTAELVRLILSGAEYHAPITALAMRYLRGGMPGAQAVLTLRGHMLAVPEAVRDLKGGELQPGRWQARYNAIPRAVSTAREKIGELVPGDGWPDPLDFIGDTALTGAPALTERHVPPALAGFVFDTAARMGVDPAALALSCIVSCAAVISEEWEVQPKAHDDTWLEGARLWGAIVGDPSILKSPVMAAATRPLDKLDAAARERHAEAMRQWRAEVARLKKEKASEEALPAQPRLDRYLVEGTTTEALTEVLRDDEGAKMRAPAGKVLARQDELSGWIGDLDRYKSGGRGGGDRAHYLRLYNGGRYVVDRVGRGSFACPSWAACLLGGIQPEPIQRIARDAADDGLLQRFLYCVPGIQAEGEDRAPDREAARRYEALFPALVALRPSRGMAADRTRPVVLHREAHLHREAINALTRAQSALPDTSARLKAALGKWPGTFARLALTFHMIEVADARARGEASPMLDVIPAGTAARAAAYMRDVLLPHLLRAEGLLFQTRQTGHVAWVARFILSNERLRDTGRVAVRDISRAYGALRAPECRREITDVMAALETMAWVRAEAKDAPGAWNINPKIYTAFAQRAAEERARRDAAREATAEAIRASMGARAA